MLSHRPPRSIPGKRILAALLIAGVPALAHAGASDRFDQGVAAYRKGDFAKSAETFKPLAEKGEPGAQYLLSCQMINGAGIKTDAERGWQMLQKASDGGYPDAQILEARRLEALKAPRAKIRDLYQQAALMDNRQALMWLALDDYSNDRKQSAQAYLERAWQQGDPRAATLLATRFTDDPDKRHDLLRAAAQRGETHAAAYLAEDTKTGKDRAEAVGWCAIASGLPGQQADIDWAKIGKAIEHNCSDLDADMKPDARAQNRKNVDQFLTTFFADYHPQKPWRPCTPPAPDPHN